LFCQSKFNRYSFLPTNMNATRAFNVLTLTTIILLAGCFGATDSSATADDEEHTHAEPNAAPVIYLQDADYMYDGFECESSTCSISVYHAVVDPDGDSMTLGWDTDLDGVIDQTLTDNSGFTEVTFPESQIDILELAFEDEDDEFEIEIGVISIAFIAVDSNGAASAEIFATEADINYAGVIDGGGSLDTYAFSDNDAQNNPAMSDDSGDALVEITMMQGSDLNWAMLKVTISVDGGTPIACGEDGNTEADCTWAPFEGLGNDQAWEAGEGITISEGDVDLCDGSDGGCQVDVTLTKQGVGSDADMVIGSVNAYADSGQ
jgi:hypothetical protein